ncbi:MAG: hypothetical protein KIT31_25260 [Deltaproteobacteria bacterium]|nr:hypothetical protein [Deltaproteobacteria bacterium]
MARSELPHRPRDSTRSDPAATTLRRARRAYEAAHLRAAGGALAIAAALILLAIGLHRTTNTTWLFATILAVTLPVLAWRGGPSAPGRWRARSPACRR